MTYLVLDTETGGLSATKHDLLSAHFIVCDEGLTIVEELGLKLLPDNGQFRVTESAMQVNGIDLDAHERVAIPMAEGARQTHAFLDKHKPMTCVGHNVKFDLRFIHAQLMTEAEWGRYCGRGVVDTMELAKTLASHDRITPKSFSLLNVASYFNAPVVGAHDARGDALMTLDCLRRMRWMGALNETRKR
jgi:DNA polymerase III alpha subunit (gram-positive type)